MGNVLTLHKNKDTQLHAYAYDMYRLHCELGPEYALAWLMENVPNQLVEAVYVEAMNYINEGMNG